METSIKLQIKIIKYGANISGYTVANNIIKTVIIVRIDGIK